ncbi:hypothetical protein ACO22_04418 [Paracoccidioides brasiliensis]|uniref:Uncharacterized protein n=1 Tax=Paracoccidioides brasiliensis TaxID=121759 RepID=A0A1D2JD36_PARBR|nr:hypothetical protein ACO22_04418 [Paracoccidioides brasiliensis]
MDEEARLRTPTLDSSSSYKTFIDDGSFPGSNFGEKTQDAQLKKENRKTMRREVMTSIPSGFINYDLGKRHYYSNDIDNDSEPEYNIYDDGSQSRSSPRPSPNAQARNHKERDYAGVLNNSYNSHAIPHRRRRHHTTDSGSPVRQPEVENTSLYTTVAGISHPKQRRRLNRRLFHIHMETDADVNIEESLETASVECQHVHRFPIQGMHNTGKRTQT